MTTDVAEIAAGLSKAQREALPKFADWRIGSRWLSPAEIEQMVRLGIFDFWTIRGKRQYRLSGHPGTGLAVRAHLKDKEADHG